MAEDGPGACNSASGLLLAEPFPHPSDLLAHQLPPPLASRPADARAQAQRALRSRQAGGLQEGSRRHHRQRHARPLQHAGGRWVVGGVCNTSNAHCLAMHVATVPAKSIPDLPHCPPADRQPGRERGPDHKGRAQRQGHGRHGHVGCACSGMQGSRHCLWLACMQRRSPGSSQAEPPPPPILPSGHARKTVVGGGGFKGKKKAGGGGAVNSIFGGLEMFSGGYDFGFNDTP